MIDLENSVLKKVIDILKALFKAGLGVLIFLGIQIFLLLIFVWTGIDSDKYQGLYSFSYSVLVILALLGFSKIESNKQNKLIKIRKPKARFLLVMIVIALGMLGIVTVYMMLARHLSSMFNQVGDELQKYSDAVDRAANTDITKVPVWDSIIYMIAITITIPIGEELVFRGVVFGELARTMKGWVSVLLSALVFALLHGLSVQIGYAFICGIIIGTVYLLSGNIVYTICLHSIFNLLGSTLLYFLQWDQMGFSKEFQNSFMTNVLYCEIYGIFLIVVVLMFTIYFNSLGRFNEAKSSFKFVKKEESIADE